MSKLAIVCVDDEELVLITLKRQLRQYIGNDCSIETAHSGDEALELVDDLMSRNMVLAVVISDYIMPRMKGDELLRRIHEREPEAMSILLTGQANIEGITNAINNANLYRYIAKPWEQTDMILTITEALRRYHQDRMLAEQNTALRTINQQFETLNATLEQRVQQRTAEVTRAHRQLEESMSRLRQAYVALSHSEIRHRALLEAIPDSMILLGHDGTILSCKAGTMDTWWLPGQGVDRHFSAGLPPHLNDLYQVYVQQALETGSIQVFEYQLPVSTTPMYIEARLVRCGDQEVLVVLRDISERKHMELKLRQMALHDSLTGLPNRTLLHDRIDHALQRSGQKNQRNCGILLIDIDDFKRINDGLGHLAGDQMLMSLAQRLVQCVRTVDTVARLGGDEFALLLEDLSDIHMLLDTTRRIQQAMRTPFKLDDEEVVVSVSIGVVWGEERHMKATDLLRDADIALYRAKAVGKSSYIVFDPSMYANITQRLSLEGDLRRALDHAELHTYYQPIVDLVSGQVVGFEALVRWQHPHHGVLGPSSFLRLATDIGLDTEIDRLVLQQACTQLHLWQTQPITAPLKISVNLSSRQFIQSNIVPYIEHLIDTTKIPAGQLMIEITEDSLIEYDTQALDILQHLRTIGVQIGLDDFGTGYSSLSYLHRFPVNVLKVDRSFINNIDTDAQSLEIVRTVIQLAGNLHMDVIAEGIETASHLACLRELNCRYGQGFVFARPLSSIELTAFLTQTQTPNTGEPARSGYYCF